MAGRGMGCAIKGGGAVGSGPKNKMLSEPSTKTGKVLMMAEGGDVNQHKAYGYGHDGRRHGSRLQEGRHAAKKKVKKMRKGGSCG
jgi:hypothetical protein